MILLKIFKFIVVFGLLTGLVVVGKIKILHSGIKSDRIFNPQTLSIKLKSFTPNAWEIFDNVLHFTPENLYEQINGRAEYYLAFDMIELTFVTYEKKGKSFNSINLSIYNMGTPTNAFGVFSGERSPDGEQLQLGRDSYRSGANYYIWKGQYYIQIFASDISREVKQVGMELAKNITNILNDSGKPVWGLKALPKKNLVPQTVQYFLVDALGLDFLQNTYIAKYTKEEEIISVFLSHQDSPEKAKVTFTKFLEHANHYGKETSINIKEGIEILLCNMGKSYDVLIQKGRLLVGVTEVKDKKVAVDAAIELWKKLETE